MRSLASEYRKPANKSVQRTPRRWAQLTTFASGRRPRGFCDRSDVRIHAQSRADLESPRAGVPYLLRCDFSPPTVLRTPALQSNRKRFRAAYDAAKLPALRRPQRKPLSKIRPPNPIQTTRGAQPVR